MITTRGHEPADRNPWPRHVAEGAGMITPVTSLHVSTAQQIPLRTLVTYTTPSATTRMGHDRESRINLVRRLGEVMGWSYAGDHEDGAEYASPPYFVPQDALLASEADALGIRGPEHLFGGVVPHAFIATKAITHPLIARNATAPEGWSDAFADWAGDSVLRG